MSDDSLESIRIRNDFYRDNYRKVLTALLALIVIIAGLIGVIFYLQASRPTPQYFATTEDGRIIRLVPLNEPLVSQNALLQWGSVASTAAYSYDFLHYRDQLQGVAKYFTPAGYQQFMDALKQSNNLTAVVERKLTSSAVVTGVPVIQAQGMLGKRYGWRIQIPILVTYQSASEQSSQNLLVTMTIVRRSTLVTPQGIGISSFITAPR